MTDSAHIKAVISNAADSAHEAASIIAGLETEALDRVGRALNQARNAADEAGSIVLRAIAQIRDTQNMAQPVVVGTASGLLDSAMMTLEHGDQGQEKLVTRLLTLSREIEELLTVAVPTITDEKDVQADEVMTAERYFREYLALNRL